MRILNSLSKRAKSNSSSSGKRHSDKRDDEFHNKKRKASSPSNTITQQCKTSNSNSNSHTTKKSKKQRSNRNSQFLQLLNALRKIGFEIHIMESDGNCMFRAIAQQVYGDAEMHGVVRSLCIRYMRAEREHFAQYETENFDAYLERKSKDNCFGNNLELQAISEMYNRPIEIYTDSEKPMNIFHSTYKTDYAPIRLSYHNGNHYNSVIDPSSPSVGVGLGLPQSASSFQSMSQEQLQDALLQSETSALEQMILAKAKQETDLSATEKEIEDIMIQSSIEAFNKSQTNNNNSNTNNNNNNNNMSSCTNDQFYRSALESDITATEEEIEQAVLLASVLEYQKSQQQSLSNNTT